MAEPDLGTDDRDRRDARGVLVVAGTPVRLLALTAGIVSLLALAAIWVEPYRRARFLSFLNPWSDQQGAGFQSVQAMIGLGSGGLFGKGLGESVQKLNYLPEAHTDMIFAIIGEELGLVGVTRDPRLRASSRSPATGSRCAARTRSASGSRRRSTTLVCGQAVVNLAAVLGLAPLTGIPLPFVSYGGSSLVVALAAVGMLLNIAADDGDAAACRC